MTRLLSAVACVAAVLALGSAPAIADTLFEVEHARAIARSGGPVSEHDAELLERWGALSGTPEWRNRTRESFYFYGDNDERPRRHQRHRRSYDD